MIIQRLYAFAFILVAFLIHACDKSSTTSNEKNNARPYIVATSTPVYDALREIDKADKLNIDYIVNPGVDPHTYNATHGDLQKLKNADMVFYNGFHFEAKMVPILKKIGRKKPVVEVAKAVPENKTRKPGASDKIDPHIWFDVSIWKHCVKLISDSLAGAYPQYATTFEKNSEAYMHELDTLDQYIRDKLKEIPKDQRILVTSHDAFGYFGNAYDIRVKGLQGVSTAAETGIRDITSLVDFIIKQNIHALFLENSVSGKSMKAVIEGCRSRGHQITMGSSLYADGLGGFDSKEGTYIGMMKSNVDMIVAGLKAGKR